MRTGKKAGEYLFLRVNEKRMARKGLMGWRDYDKLQAWALECSISFKEIRLLELAWTYRGSRITVKSKPACDRLVLVTY
ncbi:hypothetical protein GW626_04855 [Peribacillus muralis]|uniref:hypothetical protein n=1 Tax=Peribacillus muralis TaxID=264697 RepID=UPI001F4EA016|nr:hypothetical protein [Peribacillus muralis]MCK1993042.1 hypothetical protein [Peribacillus muralis]MCK2013597.1 hypothetical protein [Peribacillus muralis]